MTPRLSVVIPAFNAESTIGEAVRAIVTQSLSRELFECIVVDDGSTDRTAEIAERAGATVLKLAKNQGRCAARNLGMLQARGDWIVFTDADCVPSRRWLSSFLTTIDAANRSTLALAGKMVGLNSITPAARFSDLTGALDAETYLENQVMPWAPSGNLACRREDLLAVGGFDTRFKSYEAADLQLRMGERFGGKIVYVPAAIVMHRHRATWREFWRQQLNYGEGYAQFLLRYAEHWPWSAGREMRAWGKLIPIALQAAVGRGERGLVRRGWLVKHTAQRIGFVSTYFSSIERRSMQSNGENRGDAQTAIPSPLGGERVRVRGADDTGRSTAKQTSTTTERPLTPALSPDGGEGVVRRAPPQQLRGSGLPLWLAVGHFILRAPARLARTELPMFLARLATQPRDGADFARVARLTRRWLRVPGLRSRDTCYMQSLVFFRFVDARGGELCLHFGVDQRGDATERLHGHAWVSLNGIALNPPPSLTEGRVREIYRFSNLTGGSSTSGATSAAAIIRDAAARPALTQPVPA